MNRLSRFKDRLSDGLATGSNSSTATERDGTTDSAMIKLLPFHPKSIAVVKSTEVEEEAFLSVYDKFRSDLLSAMCGQNRTRRHELCSSLRLLENIIRLIDAKRVHYRVIMACNIFKNSQKTVSGSDKELSEAGLFPSETAYNQDSVVMISEVVARIRSLVGMKLFHETVVLAWGQVKGQPHLVSDVIVAGSRGAHENQSSFVSDDEPVLHSVSALLGVDRSSITEQVIQPTSSSFVPNEICWPSADSELLDASTSTRTPPLQNQEEPGSSYQEPCSSNSNGGFRCLDILSSLQTFFPDSHETMAKHLFDLLSSDKTSNELQGELIDLLGFEQFEMVGKILESRYPLCDEIKEAKQKATKLGKFAPDKLVPLRNDGPIYCQQVTVQSKAQAEMKKEMRKEQKRVKKELSRIQHAFGEEEKLELELAQREMMRMRQLEIDQLRWQPTLKSGRSNQIIYPYVFDARVDSGQTLLSINGMKYALPEGSCRDSCRTHEEVQVPPVNRDSVKDIQHVYIKDMDEIGQLGFKGFEKLNVIQSLVFEQAYKTRENLLICAPTGAGKTNIAMLTILNTIHEYTKPNGEIAKDDFKIIYIAPMKALATEMTDSFGKRLAPLGLKVRELTGDTQLSKKEVAETQMLVLTPEKWDVVTRKGSADTSLTALVRLLIIDEVHLLHDERGPVIETIVARTLRQVEMSQSGIRIVGLSATLPNYIDVARFLRVNPYKGLFFFDGRFRPVPLTQKFIGIKKVGGVREVQQTMDEVCYDEVIRYVRKGHQVLVFVHSRNATAKLATSFRERAAQLGHLDVFSPSDAQGTKAYNMSEKTIQSSRNSQLFELFRFGFGIHHAGLVRNDRILMEKTFRLGHVSVLFCTATLAWGVNLPAHAVVIRGTEVFSAEKGQFTDLGVLDVQQIFGRAGRPQFENEGHGVIITMQNKLDKYLGMLIRQAPIESQFFKRIHDNLNAEIALGTVSNIDEAVTWLTYTYYYTRATQNPIAYGLPHMILDKDPELRNHLSQMVTEVAVKLDKNQMIRFDSVNGFLNATDLGRIASNFYIKYETIEMLNETGLPVSMGPFMPDDMVLAVISMATEFSQLKIREEECLDLEELVSYGCVLPVRGGGLASVPGKVNVLLQSLISRTFIRSFSLSSEAMYVQQNAGRLCRAMFEMVLRKGWAQATNAFLMMAKCIEKKIWPNQSSLRQLVDFLPISIIEKIERRKLSETQLLDLAPKEIGYMFSCDGSKVFDCLRMLPRVTVEASLKPITYTIIQVDAVVQADFVWNDRLLGKGGAQSFWLFLENIDENLIIHQEKIAVNKSKVISREPQHILFTIPIRDHQLTNVFQLRISSDYYLSDDTVVPLSMHNCILPKSFKAHTDLLPLDPLPIKTLQNSKFESMYSFAFFNPIQTQVFHCLYKTDESTLIGAPTGSGKTLCAELAMFRLLQDHPGKKCVYIAPLKALVRERVSDWSTKFNSMGYKVVEVSGDFTPDSAALNTSSILITTPEKWDGISRSWSTREYVRQVGLIIIDEIHLLGVDRGAVLEAIVIRLKLVTRRSCVREAPARLVGLSTALANAGDVAEWLGIRDAGLFNFRPSVRPVPINVHIQGFPGQHYCPRMALMNKPAFKAIMTFSPMKPVLVFVASRRQTRLTATAFISHLVSEADPRQWLHMDMAELDSLLQSVSDENLKLTLPFGIGMHHAGLSTHERALVEQLYLEKKIQVLIATATLAWGINMPAHLVIVKGTEYFDGKTCKYVDFPVTDVLQMMGRAGRPQFDSSAVAVIYVQDVKKNFYKRFLYEPFPVESSLLPVLANHVNAEINAGTINSKQGVMEYLAGTYLYRRLFVNPNYYGLEDPSPETMIQFLVGVVDRSIDDLLQSSCIVIDEEEGILRSSPFGRLASIYYLQHETMRYLLAHLNETNSIEDLLKILSHVPEYAEIPVRHNEDVVNTQLQRRLRIRFPTNVMDLSNTKAHLLFQAQFGRVDIPTDYRTDQKSVLDQCIRILQAMRDICVLNGWMSTCLLVTTLQQMCTTGRWHDDHPLLALPHIRENEAQRIGVEMTIPLLQDSFQLHSANGAKDVQNRIRKLFSEKTTLEESEIVEIGRSLCHWPILHVRSILLCNGSNEQQISLDSHNRWITVEKDTVYKIKLNLETLGPNRFNTEAYLQRWSKQKSAGWIVAVGEKDSGRLFSLAHIPAVSGQRIGRIEFRTPNISGRHVISIIISSDCYLGIDQEYSILADLR